MTDAAAAATHAPGLEMAREQHRRKGPSARLALPALVLALTGLLGGCSLSGEIGRHSVAYNGSVEQATDTMLVMNVLRARDRAPLHFTAIGAIHGALSLSAAIGYDLSNVSNSAVLPALFGATNPSFDIGPLDRQEFARGLIRPIDPGLFRLLSDGGLPDQLLLHLLVSRFEDGVTGLRVVNDPRRRHELDPAARQACAARGAAAPPPCDPFQAVVDRMTARGRLTFNGYTRLIPVGPRLSRAEAAAPDILTALREPGMTLRPEGGGWRLFRAIGQLALCVPGEGGRPTAFALDAEPPQISPVSQEGDPCTAEEVAEAPLPAGHPAAQGMSWYLRSVDELLHYLGEVQRREQEGTPYRIDTGQGRTPRLFRLWEAEPARPRLSVEYRGGHWWVAEHDSAEDLTLSVLALTNQLLNLQKSAGEIPSSGTLRLIR